MADELGTAVLRLIIDDSAFKDSLNRAKTQIKNELGGAIPTPTAARPTAAPRPAALTRPAINPITGMTTAYETAQRASAELLQNDLERLQIIRQITQRLQEQADIRPGGFGEASRATFGTQDPVEKSIRRNQEKRARDAARAARQEQQAAQQRNALEEDLAQTTARRVAAEKSAASAANAVLANQQKQLANEKKLAAETAKRRKENLKLGKEIAANALIGAGFPLLFGQGFGAALGGGLGGAAGALGGGTLGFAGSIVGTALGAAFDTALQKAQTLAQGLEDPIKNFDALRQAALLSSKQVEKYAQALIDTGRSGEAAIVIQQDILNTFGSQQGAKDFAKTTDELGRSFAKATTIFASFIAGPLRDFLQGLTTPTQGIGQRLRFEQLAGQLTPEQFRQVQQTRFAATEQARARRGGLAGLLPPSTEDEAKGYQEAIKYAEKLLGIDKQRADLAARLAYAQVLTQQALSDQYRLSAASAAGLDKELGGLRQRIALQERNRKLLELPAEERVASNPRFLKIQQDTALELNRIQGETLRLDIQRSAALANSTTELRNNLQLIAAQPGAYRDALKVVQDIQTTIQKAGQERFQSLTDIQNVSQSLGFGITFEDTQRLNQAAQLANTNFANTFTAAKNKLIEAGQSIAENIRNASQDLQSLRVSNLRFLSPEERQATLDQLEADVQRLGRERGFTPTLRSTEEKAAFVQFARQEQTLKNAIVQGNAALELVNQQLSTQFADLTTRTSELTAVTASLVNKEWVVAVNVVNQAGGASTVNTVNGLS